MIWAKSLIVRLQSLEGALQAREDARARKGTGFDLKAFHRSALDLGGIGLDPLKAALERI